MFQARSGAPLTPTTTGNLSLTGLNNQRPLIVGDPSLADPGPDKWFNTAAFAPNTPGLWGNTPKGFLTGPGYWNVDFALTRSIPVGRTSVELCWETFNVFNHVTWGNLNDLRQPQPAGSSIAGVCASCSSPASRVLRSGGGFDLRLPRPLALRFRGPGDGVVLSAR